MSQYLKELPEGSVWPHLIEAMQREAKTHVLKYAADRLRNVERKAETPELAALLIEKYAQGMQAAMQIVGIDCELVKAVEEPIRLLVPNFDQVTQLRYESRPAGVFFRVSDFRD